MKSNYVFTHNIPSGNLVIYCLSALLFIQIPVFTYSQESSKRPGIGLVLSGGGAHGMAHLGVIKVMEEAGLRPDYITGVSMGSIIGGMYALGYSSDSLHKLLNSINWDDLLSNKIPENRIIFPEKEYFYNSIISLPISSKKLVLPSGLINGQQIESTLSYYSWPAADIDDFSKLPIPFMCVGADIINYKKIDLTGGYLPDAIRASFSVPSIFTPYRIDTLLLVDGGLIRNFAATEALEMGADILIGSYVGFKAYKADELESVSDIIKQIAMFRSLEDFNSQKKLINILVKPDIDRFSITDFSIADSLIREGYKAALPFKDQFRKLADSLNLIGSQKPIENILSKHYYTFDNIEIEGNNTYSDDQILGVLDISPGEQVDKDMLTDRIELLYGKAWFNKVNYKIVPANDSLVLKIHCEERPQAVIYGSLHYDNSLLSGILVGLSVNNILTKRSVIDIKSFLGSRYRFRGNMLQYLDRNQKYGISFDYQADNTLFPKLEINGETGNTFSRNYLTALMINKYSGLNSMMSISAFLENMNLTPDYVSENNLKNLSYSFFSSSFSFRRNTLDSKHFPDKGMKLNLYAGTSDLMSATMKTDTSRVTLSDSGNNPSDRFYTFHLNIYDYLTTINKITFSIGGEILYITDADSVSSQNNFYLLGGIQSDTRRSVPMAGFHPNEIPVRKMAGLRSELDFELLEDFHLNIMFDISAIEDTRYPEIFSIISGYGLGLGYMSIIGPIRAGVMYGSYSNEKYFSGAKGYISLGYNF